MSAHIEFKFNIDDIVQIKELNCSGRVISLFIGRRGIEYQVRYISPTEYKEVYFFEEDLKIKGDS